MKSIQNCSMKNAQSMKSIHNNSLILNYSMKNTRLLNEEHSPLLDE